MPKTSTVLRCISAILTTFAINLVVYTLSPGNWLVAIVPSILALTVLLPSGNDVSGREPKNAVATSGKRNSGTFMTPVILEDQDISTDDLTLNREETELHSALGKVFNDMARTAALDLYSTEITGTANPAWGDECDRDSITIEMEMDTDGTPHYVFKEKKRKGDVKE